MHVRSELVSLLLICTSLSAFGRRGGTLALEENVPQQPCGGGFLLKAWPRPTAWVNSLSGCGQKIGGGAFGTVYKVSRVDGASPLEVVVKVQKPNAKELKAMSAFKVVDLADASDRSKAWIVQLIDSATFLDSSTHQTRDVLAMEVADADLTVVNPRRLKTRQTWMLSPSETLQIFAHVLYGLKTLHEKQPKGWVHGDLKPENIFIFGNCTNGIFPASPNGCKAKLGDLGSTVLQGTWRFGPQGRTPGYDAPENSIVMTKASRKADMWAAGMILRELVFYSVVGKVSWPEPWEQEQARALKRVAQELLTGLLTNKRADRLTAASALQLLEELGISNSPPVLDVPVYSRLE